MLELAGYTLTETVRVESEFILYRAQRNDDRHPVLVMTPALQRPAPASLTRLEWEYSLRAELDPDWAVHPLALLHPEGQSTLIFEDPKGRFLEQLLAAPLELAHSLRIAIGLAVALGKVHRQGLIHKDVKPAHVLFDEASGNVHLTGFGIASRVPRQHRSEERRVGKEGRSRGAPCHLK